jgi:hypothetical protein
MPDLDLRGHWLEDDGDRYAVTQRGNTVWWVGLSLDGLQEGIRVSNVFQGQLDGRRVSGSWADVPRGITRLANLSGGSVSLEVGISAQGNPVELTAVNWTGAFLPRHFHRVIGPPPGHRDISQVFSKVRKNSRDPDIPIFWDNETLSGPLKPYRDRTAVFGWVVPDDRLHIPLYVVYRSNRSRDYGTFICTDEGDGDLLFNIRVDRLQLERQHDFWNSASGWERGANPKDILKKLDSPKEKPRNRLHIETIMYGRTAACSDKRHYNDPPLLLGWQQAFGHSVLINGIPINGDVEIGHYLGDNFSVVEKVSGRSLYVNDYVRVVGVLVVDTGHAEADSAADQGQEIHPVYSIDVFTAQSSDDLTGAWSTEDGRTLYLQHRGNEIWWLNMGPFRDSSAPSVFRGTVQAMQITGVWQDILPFRPETGGPLELDILPGRLRLQITSPGPFIGQQLIKMYGGLSDPHDVPKR